MIANLANVIHVPAMTIQDLADRLAALEDIVRQRPVDPDHIYTPAEVAERLRCSKTNVYDLIGAGEIAFVRIGAGRKGFKIKGSDLLSFLESRKEGGPQPKMSFKRLGL